MPTEALREMLRQIAQDAGSVARDANRALLHRLAAFMVIVTAASPFAAAALCAIAILCYQIREQATHCMESEHRARDERLSAEQRAEIRDEKNTLMITGAIKELAQKLERNTEVVSGKRFIPQATPKKSEAK